MRNRLTPLLLAAALGACGGSESPASPAASTRDGGGLVILPYDGPLARGVAAQDPRLNFHDFGRIHDGDVVTRVFRMRNDDPRDVSIKRVVPACGCTVAALRAIRADGTVVPGLPIKSKEPTLLTVAPGEIAELEVRVDSREISGKNADKLVNVRVETDSPNGYYLTFEVHVLVEQPFTVVPNTLALGWIPENGGGAGKVEIVPALYFSHELKELVDVPAGVSADLVKEIRNGMPLWTLRARMEAPLERGPRSHVLRIATEEEPGVPGRDIEVPLTATVVGDLSSEPERMVFAAERGMATSGTFELYSRLGGHRLRVTAVEVPLDQQEWLEARIEPLEPDDDGASLRCSVTLETLPPLPAGKPMLTGELVLTLDDPQHPTHRIGYVVHLR
jgi:hypothetical protein